MKILLVDDAELFLDLEKSYLDRSSFTFSTARSGTEALGLIRSDRPGLVILDLLMPGMDGDEVCRRIKSDPLTNTIPIIMVSSIEDPDLPQRCYAAGCDAFVAKPLKRDELLTAIEKTIVIAKRRYPRIPTYISCRVSMEGEHQEAWIHTISRGGVFLEMAPAPKIGAGMQVAFSLPGTEGEIASEVKVRWRGEVREGGASGVGCQFMGMAARWEDLIERYVNEKLAAVGSMKGTA